MGMKLEKKQKAYDRFLHFSFSFFLSFSLFLLFRLATPTVWPNIPRDKPGSFKTSKKWLFIVF